MSELSPKTREALLRVGTSTLTGVLNRRGLRSMFMHDVWPIRPDIPRMVGIAFTMRFIPSREDKDGPNARGPSGADPEPGDGDLSARPRASGRFTRRCTRRFRRRSCTSDA